MKIIKTWAGAKDWLLLDAKVKTELALKAYDEAMAKTTLGRIYGFWCMDGLGMNQEVDILWWEIYGELKKKNLEECI